MMLSAYKTISLLPNFQHIVLFQKQTFQPILFVAVRRSWHVRAHLGKHTHTHMRKWSQRGAALQNPDSYYSPFSSCCYENTVWPKQHQGKGVYSGPQLKSSAHLGREGNVWDLEAAGHIKKQRASHTFWSRLPLFIPVVQDFKLDNDAVNSKQVRSTILMLPR